MNSWLLSIKVLHYIAIGISVDLGLGAHIYAQTDAPIEELSNTSTTLYHQYTDKLDASSQLNDIVSDDGYKQLTTSDRHIVAYLWLISAARPDTLENAVAFLRPEMNAEFVRCVSVVRDRLAKSVKENITRPQQQEAPNVAVISKENMLLLAQSLSEFASKKIATWDKTEFSMKSKPYEAHIHNIGTTMSPTRIKSVYAKSFVDGVIDVWPAILSDLSCL